MKSPQLPVQKFLVVPVHFTIPLPSNVHKQPVKPWDVPPFRILAGGFSIMPANERGHDNEAISSVHTILGAPPRGRPVGHAGMAGAVGEARGRLVSAKRKVRGARIADRPAAFVLRQFEQRTALRAFDRYDLGDLSVRARRFGVDQAQELALAREAGAPNGWRA
jgi:hypothetical protein